MDKEHFLNLSNFKIEELWINLSLFINKFFIKKKELNFY